MGKSGRKRKYCLNEDILDSIWKECFSKQYKLLNVDAGESVDVEANNRYFEQLKAMKDELNNTKDLLSHIDIIRWHHHTKKMHLCGNITRVLVNDVKAELATQAWAKFYTILNSFDLFEFNDEAMHLNTVHLCEAPGSFVTSLNHFLKSKYRGKLFWNWTATTLNPYYEGNDTFQMIADDRFIIETLNNWEFGADFTGNIISHEALEHMKTKFQDVSIKLVTADGSTSCSENPAEQEMLVALLFLWEIVTALSILADKGSFVLKIFTVFEKFTISLVYLLYTFFQSVTFIKPGPSKPGNSEVYIVCQNYSRERCLNSPLFTKFVKAAIKHDLLEAVISFEELPNSFMCALVEYSSTATSNQVKAIKANLESFLGRYSRSKEELWTMKEYIAKRFLKDFSIYPIDDYVSTMFVIKNRNQLCNYDRSTAVSFKTGSYIERLSKDEPSGPINVTNVGAKADKPLEKSVKVDLFSITLAADTCQILFDSPKDVALIRGKKVSTIHSSSFISSTLLKEYLDCKKVYFERSDIRNNVEVSSNGDKITCHHELNDMDQIFPSIGLFKSKNILCISYSCLSSEFLTYFSDRGIKAWQITPSREGSNVSMCVTVVCDFGNINHTSKIKNLNILIELLKQFHCSHIVVMRVEGLILSNFWNGLFFLFSTLFKNMIFVESGCSKDVYFLIYWEFTSPFEVISKFHAFLNVIHDELLVLDENVDFLHVVNLYLLMHSDYHKYMISRNEYFVKSFINTVA